MKLPRLRLFFALWPDAATRRGLDAIAARLHGVRGGRRTRAETLHLTLVFIGEMPADRLPEVLDTATGVALPKFEILFDRCDCWRRNHIAHLGASQTPSGLLELVARLESRLEAASIAFDRRPYVPHVTLLRNADCSAEKTTSPLIRNPALVPICWPARDFVLVTSSLRPGGAIYEQLGRWPLL